MTEFLRVHTVSLSATSGTIDHFLCLLVDSADIILWLWQLTATHRYKQSAGLHPVCLSAPRCRCSCSVRRQTRLSRSCPRRTDPGSALTLVSFISTQYCVLWREEKHVQLLYDLILMLHTQMDIYERKIERRQTVISLWSCAGNFTPEHSEAVGSVIQ